MKLKYQLNNYLILAILFLSIFAVLFYVQVVKADTVINNNITTANYKCIQLDEVTNIKYLNEYKYRVFINHSFNGDFNKSDCVFIPDYSSMEILPLSNIQQSLNPGSFAGMISIGFFAFMQYGIYIIIIIFVVIWLIRRRK